MDGWFCTNCKSLNLARSTRCYSCNVPKEHSEAGTAQAVGTWKPTDVPKEARSAVSAAGLAYESSAARARIVVPLIAAVMVLSIARFAIGVATGTPLLLTNYSGGLTDTLPLTTLILVRGSELAVYGVAIAAFLWWLSRVVANIPALGGGWPPVSPTGAIGWWLVPGANLFQGPRIVADAHERLHVDGRPGTWLVGLWWGSFLGTYLIERAATWIVSIFSPEAAEATPIFVVAGTLREILFLAAGAFAIWIVNEIEALQETRSAALEGVPAPLATATAS